MQSDFPSHFEIWAWMLYLYESSESYTSYLISRIRYYFMRWLIRMNLYDVNRAKTYNYQKKAIFKPSLARKQISHIVK